MLNCAYSNDETAAATTFDGVILVVYVYRYSTEVICNSFRVISHMCIVYVKQFYIIEFCCGNHEKYIDERWLEIDKRKRRVLRDNERVGILHRDRVVENTSQALLLPYRCCLTVQSRYSLGNSEAVVDNDDRRTKKFKYITVRSCVKYSLRRIAIAARPTETWEILLSIQLNLMSWRMLYDNSSEWNFTIKLFAFDYHFDRR